MCSAHMAISAPALTSRLVSVPLARNVTPLAIATIGRPTSSDHVMVSCMPVNASEKPSIAHSTMISKRSAWR